MLEHIVSHPLAPFIAGTLLAALLTQIWKLTARLVGIRHHRIVERSLPLVPVALGGVLFGAFPHELAVAELVGGGHHTLHVLGALFGAGAGFASIGVYKMALDYAPEKLRHSLRVDARVESGEQS